MENPLEILELHTIKPESFDFMGYEIEIDGIQIAKTNEGWICPYVIENGIATSYYTESELEAAFQERDVTAYNRATSDALYIGNLTTLYSTKTVLDSFLYPNFEASNDWLRFSEVIRTETDTAEMDFTDIIETAIADAFAPLNS